MNLQLLVEKLFYDNTGQMFISGLFGLTLAFIFQRVCKDNCTVFYSPNVEEIKHQTFKLEDTCYKYSPVAANCNDKPVNPYNPTIKPDNKIEEDYKLF